MYRFSSPTAASTRYASKTAGSVAPALLAIIALACAPSGTPRRIEEHATHDEDGDTISDLDEGRSEVVDSDGDGIADFQDRDSDGDGIPDELEAGDTDRSTPPTDSDSDGLPDFRDLDSDGNGIPDRAEGIGDVDGDGGLDFTDRDDDGDYIDDTTELAGMISRPPDHDEDGVPDYRDPDSDKDTILDGHDGRLDTDQDGRSDFADDDSDNDGISDADEAGDMELRSPPIDTDGDGTPDFQDADSDDDGLGDRDEALLGTNPRGPDSDGDGVTDLVEYVAGTDPLDAAEDPRSRGDFVFVVPYQNVPTPSRDTLAFRTSIQKADIYFSFDTSTTMIEEMDAMRSSANGIPALISRLTCDESASLCSTDVECTTGEICGPSGRCSEDPSIDGCLLDLWTGVGRWDHIDSYQNILSLQPDPTATATAIPTAPDWWVAPTQPPACVAEPSLCTNTPLGCASSGIGCPGFRPDAVRIYVQITDANDECRCGTGLGFPCDLSAGPAARCSLFTPEFAGTALRDQGIHFIGLIGVGAALGEGDAATLARDIGIAAGSVDDGGSPFVYSATDAMVVDRSVEAVRELVTASTFDISISAANESGDALQFIERLEINAILPECAVEAATRDGNGDGFDDAFDAVHPGTRVCWDVVVRQNRTVMHTSMPQVFEARLTVFAHESEVDTRIVYFLVPAEVEVSPVI